MKLIDISSKKTLIFQFCLLLSVLFITSLFSRSNAQQIKLQANLGHSGTVTDIKFSPDGKTFVSASLDHTLILWDVKTGREILTFKGHTSGIQTFAFSPDGSKIVSSDEDNMRVWDVKTGKEILYIEDQSSESISFISNKTFLTGTVFLYKFNVNTGAEDKKYFFSQEKAMIDGFVSEIAVSNDNKIMAVGSSSNIIQIVRVFDGKKKISLKGHSSKEIHALCFSPDDKYLASAGHGPIKLWDVETYKEIKTFNGHSDIVNDIKFSPDGKKIASVSDDGNVIIWDVENRKSTHILKAHKAKVYCVDFSPDGKLLLSGGEDKKIRMWDVNSGIELFNIGDRDIMHHVTFSMNDKKIIAQSVDMSLKTWESKNTDNFNNFSGHISGNLLYGFDREGKFVFSYKHVWSIDSLKEVFSIEDHSPEDESTVLFSKDNRYYYLEETFGILKIDLNTGKKIGEVSAGVGFKAVAISPDDKFLVSSEDNIFESYDIKTGKLKKTFNGHTEDILCLSISSDGEKVFSGSEDMHIKIWDASGGYELLNLSGHSSFVTALAVNPAGKIVASGSDDNTIKLWDTDSGELLATLNEHTAGINSLSFSEKDKFLISSSKDGSVRLWDVKDRKLLASLFCIKNSEDWVVVSPNGRFDGTVEGIKKLHIVKNSEIIPLPSLFEKYYSPKLLSTLLASREVEKPFISLNEIKLPPNINLFEPATGNVFKTKDIQVKVSWPELEKDIQEVLLYHNNKLEKRIYGFKPDSENQLDLTLTLINGENLIKVIAVNSQRTESVPEEVKVYYDGIKASSDLYMMIIAVDEHKNPNFNLKYAVTDAKAIGEKIKAGSEKIFSNTTVEYLLNSDATRKNIEEKLDYFNKLVKPEDVFIFYFAGHGTMNLDSVPEFYMIPHDVTRVFGTGSNLELNGLSGNDLKNFSENLKAQKQLFIIDACHSGALIDILSTRGFEKEKAIAQLARSTGTFWLVASETEQYALELNNLGHGLFTYAVLQGLGGDADGKNNDQKITVKELSAFINDFVPEYSEKLRGTPQYPTSFG
ncbi:MAG: caspase family protein, partial [Bacteroidales bacterium]|nr:caspase family protein [Bacteroidales bacterium]